ncbi:MAG: U32 family peptidase, partial [Verrucomicrobia bacterium]|nr:U32 family peptidase [Verrucomicrobiota bacterium]
PLHASTMMNVHSVESARALKLMGFTRVITSRDIPLHEVRRIGEATGLEMEYFVHGDLCICQSAQCYLSGQLFGQSSNRGRCMKPCRWKWALVGSNGDGRPSTQSEGHLLARKDLCLFQHIPALVQNGIAALKIEGRMRTAEFIAPLVKAYREAVDAYFADPAHYVTDFETMSSLWERRVREFTTCHAFTNPGAVSVDPSGRREPRFFSESAPEPRLTVGRHDAPEMPKGDLELVVRVSSTASAEAAVKAGANAVYIGGDEFVRHATDIRAEWLGDFAAQMSERGVRVAALSPRISDERDLAEWRWWLTELARVKPLGIGVSNLGALQAAREMGAEDIIADFSFNVTNSVAADELSTMGATRATASIELNFTELQGLLATSRLPIEVIGQGPLPGMVLEHCVIAAATGDTPQGVCPMNCRRAEFALHDANGQAHRIEGDRRCRNHLYMASDVCVLPNLGLLAGTRL